MWKKKQVLQIDDDAENRDDELKQLQKRNGSGSMLFKMGITNDPKTAYNSITDRGQVSFAFLLSTLSSDDLQWMLAKMLEEIARRAEVEAEINKIKFLAENDPNFEKNTQLEKK